MESCDVCKKLNKTKIDRFYPNKDLPTIKGLTGCWISRNFWDKISCLFERDLFCFRVLFGTRLNSLKITL